jgi:hypothetical protein
LTEVKDKDLARFVRELPAIIERARDGDPDAVTRLLAEYYFLKSRNVPIDARLQGYLFRAVSNLSKSEFERNSKRLDTSKIVTLPELILEILPGLPVAEKGRIVQKISRNPTGINKGGRPVKSFDTEHEQIKLGSYYSIRLSLHSKEAKKTKMLQGESPTTSALDDARSWWASIHPEKEKLISDRSIYLAFNTFKKYRDVGSVDCNGEFILTRKKPKKNKT